MSHNDHTIPPARRGSVPSTTRRAVPAVSASMARRVRDLVDPFALASLLSPDDAGTVLDLHEGQVGVLPFRPGLTCPGRAWSARLAWAALILYPQTTTPIKYPITEDRLASDTAQAKVYLFPAHIFTEQAWRKGDTFQHIDHINDNQPGVFWINLDDAPARGDLNHYEITNLSITDQS
ncbi:hypothetical protein [Actinomadura harenae]|uniref:Uncharacterized protein n=1 Tax=Actinomadura harenae TaxID=2483351 RepID=A0A3M2LNB3_9ACTN|nr:hypothetical protein [Actinomadura harenae]RMI38350.1 hypothetical protein EBO15_33115 [Actinomadura harenae]